MENNEDEEQVGPRDDNEQGGPRDQEDNAHEQLSENADEVIATDCSPKGKWPDSVGFREDDPKRGMVYLILRLDALKTNVPLRGEATALNGEVLDEQKTFGPRDVRFRLKITSGTEEGKVYEYKKALPKEIDPQFPDTRIKFDENGQVRLRLRKAKPDLSWAHHRHELTMPDPE